MLRILIKTPIAASQFGSGNFREQFSKLWEAHLCKLKVAAHRKNIFFENPYSNNSYHIQIQAVEIISGLFPDLVHLIKIRCFFRTVFCFHKKILARKNQIEIWSPSGELFLVIFFPCRNLLEDATFQVKISFALIFKQSKKWPGSAFRMILHNYCLDNKNGPAVILAHYHI